VSACDEFIYYDDLVREDRARKKKTAPSPSLPPRRRPGPNSPNTSPLGEGRAEGDDKLQEALDLLLATIEALIGERGEDEPIWGSMVKQTLKRRKPGFNERYYGFGSFNELLEEARTRGLLALERDAKSGGYLVRPA